METIYLDPNHYLTQQIMDTIIADLQDKAELNLVTSLNAKFSQDGDQFCWLYGELPNNCILGFGSTAKEATHDFWMNFHNYKATNKELLIK